MPKTLKDLQHDAVYLHALAQGIEELYDTVQVVSSPASNSLCAIILCMREKADALANELDRLETESGKQVAA